jgi:hypothetical protein
MLQNLVFHWLWRDEFVANVYHVELSDGQSYTVTTEHHHDDHDAATFRRHLLDVIKSSVAGVVSGTIVHFLHKGRK